MRLLLFVFDRDLERAGHIKTIFTLKNVKFIQKSTVDRFYNFVVIYDRLRFCLTVETMVLLQ